MQTGIFGKKGVPWVLLGCSVILNIVLLVSRPATGPARAAVASKPQAAAPQVAAPAPAAAPVQGPQEAWQQAHVAIEGSLEGTFVQLLGESGKYLAPTISRLLVWDMNLRTDLTRKDRLDVIYREVAPNDFDIAAVRLHLAKSGRTLKAYKFQQAGDKYATWWREDGIEVPHQLKNSPMKDYQQITSLIGDGRGHDGMDFKAAVGSEVVSPFAGKVLRSNWNWGPNGNCIEVQYTDGTLAKFLHLSENKVKPGDTVQAGQVIALSGNTGRSLGPHLHYQLNQGAKMVDPRVYHGTVRRELSGAIKGAFQATVVAYDAQMTQQTAGL